MFIGMIFLLATYTLSIPLLGTEAIGKALETVFIIFLPNFNLGLALMDIFTNAGYKTICSPFDCTAIENAPVGSKFYGQTNPCCFPGNYSALNSFTKHSILTQLQANSETPKSVMH